MAAAPVATGGPSGLPSPSPRSPTLSERSFDSSMILPDGGARSISPQLYAQRPPSPSSFYAHANRSTHTLTLATVPPRFSPQSRSSPQLSSRSSHSTLRNMNTAQPAADVPSVADDALASSPTMHESSLLPATGEPDGPSQRRLSNTSSLNSEDLETIRNRWPGFDGQDFDDSGVDLEDEGTPAQSSSADADNELENGQWRTGRIGEHKHTFSSDLYAQRAEMILADAKKRLNVMEGNLRGARQSLVVSPTFNGSKTATELQQQINAARERDRRLYAGIGPIPPRNRPYQSSPLSSLGNPSHTRGMSETSVPLPFSSPTYMAKAQPSKRSSSAMGHGSGPWSPEGYGNGRFPIRESRSFEVMRDPRGNGSNADDPLRTHSRGSRSPQNVLETLPEDGSPKLHRSSSTTSSLREQVNDLKGRISSLRLRTQEDSLRRRSQQSLRGSSPFTSAESWYSGTEAYNTPGSPINADAGVGIKLESPSRKALYEDEASGSMTRLSPAAPYTNSTYAVKEVHRRGQNTPPKPDEVYAQKQYDDWDEHASRDESPVVGLGLGLDLDETDDDFASVLEDEVDAGSSIYEDAVYEMPATERHEDRIDAFDYENFFLHSAMGTYSAARPGSAASSRSTDSAATTRPVTAVLHTRNVSTGSAKRVSMHQRNSSVASVSTVASFETAAEGLSDDEEEENPQMDQFSQQMFPDQQLAPRNICISPRSDSAHNTQKPNSSPSQGSMTSRVSTPASGDIVTGLQTSKMFAILLESPRDEPQLALNEEEKQLIYSLAASFQQVTANLKSTTGDQYKRKEWRRRLDEARRVLDGEEPEGHPF